jgi:hypothetical protein
VLLSEEYVVSGLAVEGWVQVDQVNGLVWNIASQDVEIVAIVKGVLCHRFTSV